MKSSPHDDVTCRSVFCGSFLKCPLQKIALSTVHWDTTRQPISWLPCANSRCCPKEALPAAWFGGAARIRRCWRWKTMRGSEGNWGYLSKRWHWKPEQTSFNHHDQKTVYDGIIEHWMGFNILIEHREKRNPLQTLQICIYVFFFVWTSPLPFLITRWYIPNSFKHLLRLYLGIVFWVQTPSEKVFDRDMII